MIEPVSRQRWRTLASSFLDDNYQQGRAYGEALARRHHAVCEHMAIVSEGEILGLAGVRIRYVPLLKGGIAYISGGPLTRRGRADDIARLTRCLELLRAEYVDRRGLILRILAPLGSPAWNRAATKAFAEAGMTPTRLARSYRTFLLEIDRPLEEIRADCSKYWRRNLRRAERNEFVVRAGTTRDLFEPIVRLYERLLDRKRFRSPLDASFYAGLQRKLNQPEKLVATVVEIRNEPVAGLLSSMLGDTCTPVILAADVSGLRSYAAYLLQWHSIVMAHERGLGCYDLGGIDPEANPGVYNFKKGLRGLDLSAPGPYESIPLGAKGAISRGAEGLYRRLASAARPQSLSPSVPPFLIVPPKKTQ
ncbi:MAG: lipid II:glycine glycyltransferase FemX [Planctomycetota bacterium]